MSALVAVLAIAAGTRWWAVSSTSPASASPASATVASHPNTSSISHPPARPATRAQRVTSLVVPEAPLVTELPSGHSVPVRAVSTREDGTLDVPEDINTAGWWRGGSRVGDLFGSMLVAAHIDSRTQGLGPYAELLDVRRGQRVQVLSRHLRQAFEVRSLRLVPQGSLAEDQWIYAPAGRPRLTLVTCAPPYDASRGGYQNLAIVTAMPVAGPTRRSR